MKYKVDGYNFKEKFYEIVLKNKDKIINDNVIPKIERIIDVLEKNILDVIGDYNTGRIERHAGDYSKRQEDNIKYGRNMPLIKTGDYKNSISGEITSKTMGEIQARVFSKNIDYAWRIEEGNKYTDEYRVFEIALIRSKKDIDNILNGEVI